MPRLSVTGPCYGGAFDDKMEIGVQLIIPPVAYFVCHAASGTAGANLRRSNTGPPPQ